MFSAYTIVFQIFSVWLTTDGKLSDNCTFLLSKCGVGGDVFLEQLLSQNSILNPGLEKVIILRINFSKQQMRTALKSTQSFWNCGEAFVRWSESKYFKISKGKRFKTTQVEIRQLSNPSLPLLKVSWLPS